MKVPRRFESSGLVEEGPERALVGVLHLGELVRPVAVPEAGLFENRQHALRACQLVDGEEVALNPLAGAVFQLTHRLEDRLDLRLAESPPLDPDRDAFALEVPPEHVVGGLAEECARGELSDHGGTSNLDRGDGNKMLTSCMLGV